MIVREDLTTAHERFWKRLAAPGTWWSGAERVAIAAETRGSARCTLCAARRDAVSPHAVSGEHDHSSQLPGPAIDAIHRIATDPGRLTRKWLDSLVSRGLRREAYVELIGIVAAVVSVDSFRVGIGAPLHPLPEPVPGEPPRRATDSAVDGEAWVPMIPRSGLGETEQDLWGRGFVPNVGRALSAVPDEVRGLKELSIAHYLPMEAVADPTAPVRSLTRPQAELVAARVSALNQCFY